MPDIATTPQKRAQYVTFGPYRLGRTIGEGEVLHSLTQFGKVKLAHHNSTGKEVGITNSRYSQLMQVAVKLIKKESISSTNRHNKLLREIQILQQISHRYIVKLIEVIETDGYIGMILEYASGGELFEHILARRYLKENEAARMFSQLVAGVSHLHNHKIVHRDLKLENLLLDVPPF
jgi:serine/threonine protein kinase